MNKSLLRLVLIFTVFSVHLGAFGQQKIRYSLQDIIARAKSVSPAALSAQTRKENNYWQYRFYKSNYNPQLGLNGTIPSYSQSVTAVTQPDGTIEYRQVEQNLVDMELGLQQQITATGGTISVNSSTSRFDNFLAQEGENGTRWSGVPVNVRLSQPIFAFNPLKWDRKIEPLRYEESKKSYVEEMEQISQRATQLFFNYLLAQIRFDIASQNKSNTEEIYKIEKGRYNIGTTTEDQLLQVELRVLQAEQDLASARLDLESSSLELKSFIGLNESAEFELVLPDDIPEFKVDVDKAIDLAFENRSDAVAFKRRKLEAEAEVARAKGQRFNMNLNASYGYNNAGFNWANIYDNPNQQAVVNLRISVPLLDWGRNKARMGIAEANQELVNYTLEQEIVTFEQEIFTKVKNFQQLKDRIMISEKADEVAAKRYEISRQRYLSGKVNITDLNIAQTEKDSNRERYISSLREYWAAYYELRQLTLYDFENDNLLYDPDLEEK
ncbi:TolC family protein [Echinicola jeungdonensis]|uniref:TolC family protein n=1 Tax=Echinicola jeungdonensis TaxID=709343 RepID=A0ABV5J2I5_9BACT|nr:TolC family protein [Echinicola jeungdonensis]MDN3668165.1 TolC family protein [Echinicola jeungdonensis]